MTSFQNNYICAFLHMYHIIVYRSVHYKQIEPKQSNVKSITAKKFGALVAALHQLLVEFEGSQA